MPTIVEYHRPPPYTKHHGAAVEGEGRCWQFDHVSESSGVGSYCDLRTDNWSLQSSLSRQVRIVVGVLLGSDGNLSRVKCSVCEKNLMAEKFSNKQKQLYLSALKQSKGKPVPLIKHPKCTKCTGQQVVEMTCKYCEITKGLDQFSKVQRSNPDNAVKFYDKFDR